MDPVHRLHEHGPLVDGREWERAAGGSRGGWLDQPLGELCYCRAHGSGDETVGGGGLGVDETGFSEWLGLLIGREFLYAPPTFSQWAEPSESSKHDPSLLVSSIFFLKFFRNHQLYVE